MAKTAGRKKKPKRPRTFSLSEDVIEVLEWQKKQGKADSLTSAIEEIVRDWKKRHLGDQFTAYYDSLSNEEAEEQERWGEFSESQM
ncbi:MAG TPA: hypothetical protein VF133_01195 [Terriglobales bacterium]